MVRTPAHAHPLSIAHMPANCKNTRLRAPAQHCTHACQMPTCTRSALHTCLPSGKNTRSRAPDQYCTHACQLVRTPTHVHPLSTVHMPATCTRSALHTCLPSGMNTARSRAVSGRALDMSGWLAGWLLGWLVVWLVGWWVVGLFLFLPMCLSVYPFICWSECVCVCVFLSFRLFVCLPASSLFARSASAALAPFLFGLCEHARNIGRANESRHHICQTAGSANTSTRSLPCEVQTTFEAPDKR